MGKPLSESDKALVKECVALAKALNTENRNKLLWFGLGLQASTTGGVKHDKD